MFRTQRWLILLLTLLGSLPVTFARAGEYFQVNYQASLEEGELQMGVNYTLWVPAGEEPLRGVIVHQHGCGTGACQGGATAAYDLHWQALATKYHCALLGPSYHQAEEQNCRLWCDPRNGSDAAFLRSLEDFAKLAKRPELTEVPWCLWGHSGGAFWASLMQTMHPERIVALWFRSGGAITAWEKGEIPEPKFPEAAYGIPAMCNPGVKEKDDPRYSNAWVNASKLFDHYRAKGAPIGFAPDPRTAHDCGDSRYLAIPYFAACLELRLPVQKSGTQALRPIDQSTSWLAPLLGTAAQPAASYQGEKEKSVWLPNEKVAGQWSEYVQTGETKDSTPPEAPTALKAVRTIKPAEVELTWQAEADFESGLQSFLIERDGVALTLVPEKPSGQFGRSLFQGLSYHDTPTAPVRELKFLDTTAQPEFKHKYRIIAVNSVGLKSKASEETNLK